MLRDWVSRRFGQRLPGRTRVHRPRRSRSLRAELDCLEGRALLSATSAVAWTTGGVTHSAFYAVGQNDAVEVSVDGGGFTNLGGPLGGPAKQISAGLDAFNQPEVYAIGANNAVYVKDGAGPWVSLGFYAKAISATVENAIYAIAIDHHRYQSGGVPVSGWANLGGPASGPVRQISAGADAIGNPKVYAIGTDNGVYVNLAIGGFTKLFSYAKQISATMKDTV